MLVYLLFESAMLFVLFKSSPKRITRSILLIAFCYAVLAFFQIASQSSDLQVAFRHLRNIRQSGWAYFAMPSASADSYFMSKPGLQAYFYLLSFLPAYNFYPAISIFIIYFCALSAIHHACAHGGTDSRTEVMLLAVFILMFDFYDASNGVRNALAFSIFAYFLVCELYGVRCRAVCFAMYVVSATIHPAAWVLLLFRLLLCAGKTWQQCLIAASLLLWNEGLEVYAALLGMLSNIPLFRSLHGKIVAYSTVQGLNSNFDNFNTSASYMMMWNFRIFYFIVILFVLYLIWRRSSAPGKMAQYCLYLAAFSLGSAATNIATNVLTRYSFCMMMLGPVLYAQYLSTVERKAAFKFGIVRFDLPLLLLFVCTVLFNLYMYPFHYLAFDIGVKLYV